MRKAPVARPLLYQWYLPIQVCSGSATHKRNLSNERAWIQSQPILIAVSAVASVPLPVYVRNRALFGHSSAPTPFVMLSNYCSLLPTAPSTLVPELPSSECLLYSLTFLFPSDASIATQTNVCRTDYDFLVRWLVFRLMLTTIHYTHPPPISFAGLEPSHICPSPSVSHHDNVAILHLERVQTYSTQHQVLHIVFYISQLHLYIVLPKHGVIFLFDPSHQGVSVLGHPVP